MIPPDVVARTASVDDLDAIVAIEAVCFEPPWSEVMLAEELARPIARVTVATLDGSVVGFTCTWYVVDEAHLHRIAVPPKWRRRGIAARLLAGVLADAAAAGCATVDLEVARRNAPALALYAGAGFVVVGHRRGYYQHPPDDALLLRAELAAPAAAPRPS